MMIFILYMLFLIAGVMLLYMGIKSKCFLIDLDSFLCICIGAYTIGIVASFLIEYLEEIWKC